MTQSERAHALGISVRYLRKLEARGMPTDLEGAREWRAANLQPRNVRQDTEVPAVISGLEAAIRVLAKDASDDTIREAARAHISTLRERGIDEAGIGGYFNAFCNTLGI